MGRRSASARALCAIGLAALGGGCQGARAVAPVARAPAQAPRGGALAMELPERDPAARGDAQNVSLADTPDDRDGTGIVGELEPDPDR